MVPLLHGLLLLWLGWVAGATAQKKAERVVQATELDTVVIPCVLGGLGPTRASNYLNLTWLGPRGMTVLNIQMKYDYPEQGASPDMDWGLLIQNISRQDGIGFTCRWEGNLDDDKNPEEELEHKMENSSRGYPNFFAFARDPASFPCIGSETSNLTRRGLYWIQYNISKTVLKMLIWHATPYQLGVNPDAIFLALPSVTSRDTGNYTCYWKNQSQHFQLEVSAKSDVWLYFGKQHWIIWSVALGYMFVCLGFLYFFLRLRRGFRACRQKKMRREPAMRKIFQVQHNRAPASDGILLNSVNRDGREQVDAFSYENVLPSVTSRGVKQSLPKGNTLPASSNVELEDNEEAYECPDSETEQKSDNEDNYENAQEEVKQEDVVLNDGSPYENSKKERCGSDGDNYENVEEEPILSPGAARLIAGLRLHLALDPQGDKQDGGSEASTGSQSYEEMNGTLSPTTSKGLHTSNEEDADSYENMESPSSFSLRREGNMEPQGEGAAFSSVRQNLSIPFGADLKGDAECYENMEGPNSFSLRREGNMEPQGEDAGCYENMESPSSFGLCQEGYMDPKREGAAFGSVRQNFYVPFGADLKGGL